MQGLPMFNESFDTNPPQPMDKTIKDGSFHVNVLNAKKDDSPVIMQMYLDTNPKFQYFSTAFTLYEAKANGLKIMNEGFNVRVKTIKAKFLNDRRKIIGKYPPGSDGYNTLYRENISDMFNVGIASKLSNIDLFILILNDFPDLSSLIPGLIALKKTITDAQEVKKKLETLVAKLEKDARAKQKIFCIEERGNSGGLLQLYKNTPYLCNEFFLVTDIKHYAETEGAKAKKDMHLHEFSPNTITIVTGVLLTSSCKTYIKNLSLETVRIGSTFSYEAKSQVRYQLEAGKTFKGKINKFGAFDNTLLVVDTTGLKEIVKLKIIIK